MNVCHWLHSLLLTESESPLDYLGWSMKNVVNWLPQLSRYKSVTLPSDDSGSVVHRRARVWAIVAWTTASLPLLAELPLWREVFFLLLCLHQYIKPIIELSRSVKTN